MNKEEIILRGIDEIPMFTFNTKTKEFSVLGHKFEGVNSIEDFINYIHNLGKENKLLKEKVNQLEEELKYTVPIVEHNKIVSEKLKENQQLQQKVNQLETKINEVKNESNRLIKKME